MANYNQNSQSVTVFHAFPALEKDSTLAGYAALIEGHDLLVPAPDYLCAIGSKHRRYDNGCWHILTPRHKPDDTLPGHLKFALKYEGIDLAALKALFSTIEKEEIINIVRSEPTGAYSRRIWFLYEWLCEDKLDIEDVKQGNFVAIINDALQYPRQSSD